MSVGWNANSMRIVSIASHGFRVSNFENLAELASLNDLGGMHPPAFHIEASTLDFKSCAVDLHTAFREVALPTVATHRPCEFDGFVAFWAMYSRVHMHLCSWTKIDLLVRMHGCFNVAFSTRCQNLKKIFEFPDLLGVYRDQKTYLVNIMSELVF